METINNNKVFDKESPAEYKLKLLKELFPEFFFDGVFNKNEFISFCDALSEDSVSNSTYGLNWFGRQDALKILRKNSNGGLTPNLEESLNFENANHVIIRGENLEVMKMIQKAYFGSFKMIYMDPPYNTGEDFIYEDNVEDNLSHYLDFLSKQNDDASVLKRNKLGRHTHSRWLSMMFPRLFVARNLLSEDGAIFVSIDDHESHFLRILMDEVFGAENFVCSFIWEKRYAPAPDAKDVAYMHENILCYRRSDAFKAGLLPMTDEQVSRYKNPDSDPRGPWKAADYTCRFSATERPTLYYPITNPNTGKEVYPKKTRVWACSLEEHLKNVAEKRIWWPATASVPSKKSFLSDIKQGGMPNTILSYDDVGHTDEATKELRKWFPEVKVASKPTRLMKHLIRIANVQKSDLILDCFAGTGTMAEAVIDLNAKEQLGASFMLIQFPERVDTAAQCTMADIAIDRAKKSMHEISAKNNEGIRCFSLTDSAFAKPSTKKPLGVEELVQQLTLFVDNIKKGKLQEEILFEVMLNNGMKLTTNYEKKETAGIQFFSINHGKIIVCLQDKISNDFVELIINRNPSQVIILDKAFAGDDQLKTNTLLRMQNKGIKFSTV